MVNSFKALQGMKGFMEILGYKKNPYHCSKTNVFFENESIKKNCRSGSLQKRFMHELQK